MKKILIVEDEKILAELYKDKLSQEGFLAYLAFSSEEALSLAQKEKPDLILLDILLPRENGVAFLGHLRKEEEISKIIVVAFSNYDDLQTKKEALELGAKAYLLKTKYTPAELVKEIKKYLSN